MAARRSFRWIITEPASRGGDAVAEALGCTSAEFTYGPYGFAFTTSRTPAGDLLLGLCADPLCDDGTCRVETDAAITGYAPTQLIGSVRAHELPASEREAQERRMVRALGTALFDDVGRFVRSVSRFSGRP
jgi:hypothetical protein